VKVDPPLEVGILLCGAASLTLDDLTTAIDEKSYEQDDVLLILEAIM
jgi:hypothetical protein